MNRLKELRQEKGLTQQALADEIGVTKITILRWEKGDRQIKPEKAQQLADYFGVSVGYLLGYSEDSEFKNHLLQKFSEGGSTFEDGVKFAMSDDGEYLSEILYKEATEKEKQKDEEEIKFIHESIDNLDYETRKLIYKLLKKITDN